MNELNKMKYRVPSGLRNPQYDFFFDKLDEVVEFFTKVNPIPNEDGSYDDWQIENIKNAYNISSGSLSDLQSICEDIFCFNFNFVDRLYHFIISENHTEEDALRIIRNELMRFPYMIKNRGTIRFYDMLCICGQWNFNNIITLCPQDDVSVKVGKSHTNIDLYKHGSDVEGTSLCKIPTSEDYLAHKFEETTLDIDLYLDTPEQSIKSLDIQYDIIDTPYKRNVFVGLNLNEDKFSNSLFPKEIAYYLINVLSLYKKATENIIFSLTSSMKIDETGEIDNIANVINNKEIKYDNEKPLYIKYFDDNNNILYTATPDTISYDNGELKFISFYEGYRIKSIEIDNPYVIGQKVIRFSYEHSDNAQIFNLKRFIKIYSDTHFIIMREVGYNHFEFVYSDDNTIYSYQNKYIKKPNIKLYWNEINYEITIDVSTTDCDLSVYNKLDISAYKYETNVKSLKVYNGSDELTSIEYKKPIDIIERMYMCNIITRLEDL